MSLKNALPAWKDGPVKTKILNFISEAIREGGDGYIPKEDRIVVTDIDGTLIPEMGNKVDNDLYVRLSAGDAKSSLESISENYFDKEKGYRYGHMVFSPMMQLLELLQENDFTVYFASGNTNSLTYAWANLLFDADYSHAIGSNVELALSESGKGIKVTPTGKYEGAWCGVKCTRIYNQIGQCPVVALGNSDGDYEMLRWVNSNPKYESLSLMVNHDDEREYVYNVESVHAFCEEYDITECSMKDNFNELFIPKYDPILIKERKLERQARKAYIRELNEAPKLSVLEEVGNAVTHGIGALLALIGFILILGKADTGIEVMAACFYGFSIFFLMLMSCLYHAFRWGSTVKRLWRRFDYSSIYLLIGGTFAPMYLVFFQDILHIALFTIMWGLIMVGITFVCIFGPGRLKWLHFPLYFLIGWSALVFLPAMYRINPAVVWWILGGGVVYTLGMIPFWMKKRGAHFIWHLFVLGGAITHWICIYTLVY